MAATKRAQPATHPTVYVGLALAAVGLLLAVYAYTGTRIYDVRFAFVALLGALLAVVGIFASAWGRAIMASRAQRSRRALMRDDAVKVVEEAGLAAPPTVAAPESKKRLDLSKWVPRRPRKEPAAAEEPAKAPAGAFAFRRRASPPPPPPPPAEEAPVVAVAEAPPARERITLKCPRCSTQFVAEGVRPLPVACPSCGLSGTL